jgi:uncharacterized protein YecT (DUF1311 family)
VPEPVAPLLAHSTRRAGPRRRVTLVAALAVGITLPLAVASAHTKLSPPVIHEPFTLLPCPPHPVSTVDLEGCAEHRIVRIDHKIDLTARAIFTRPYDDAARLRFIAAGRAWLAYRQADCTSMSDQYEGGTLAAVVAATCTADRSTQRLRDLQSFLQRLGGQAPASSTATATASPARSGA